MRKPAVILLLFCFLFQAGGLWLLMYTRQMTLKKEMRSMLRLNLNQVEQTKLEFNLVRGEPADPSFVWEDENEFRYNGSIYDVIEKNIVGDKLQLRCIDDVKEAALIKKLEALQKEQQGNQQRSGSVILQHLLSLLFFHPNNYCGLIVIKPALLYIDHYFDSFTPVAMDILTPPPRQTRSYFS